MILFNLPMDHWEWVVLIPIYRRKLGLRKIRETHPNLWVRDLEPKTSEILNPSLLLSIYSVPTPKSDKSPEHEEQTTSSFFLTPTVHVSPTLCSQLADLFHTQLGKLRACGRIQPR